MTCQRSWVHFGTIFPQRAPDLFRFGWATVSNLTKFFALSAPSRGEARAKH
jgi:hypothetical protein